MALINIKRLSPTSVVFEPDPAELDSATDFAVWANLDPDAPHQPSLPGKAKDWWMDNPLPPFVAGQAAATSPQINLNATVSGVVNNKLEYVDGLDSNIKGTIAFVSTPLP